MTISKELLDELLSGLRICWATYGGKALTLVPAEQTLARIAANDFFPPFLSNVTHGPDRPFTD